MQYAAVSDVGLKRKINEDNYTVLRGKAAGLFAVADVMGGHAAGEVASRLALETMVEELSCALDQRHKPFCHLLEGAVREANRRVYSASAQRQECRHMGTTLTALLLTASNRAFVAHVGDSRAYLLHGGTCRQLSRDHSLVGELLARGSLSEEEAMYHPQRHYLERALGTECEVDPDMLEFQGRTGDRILLCTDGLSSLVFRENIREIILETEDIEIATRRLVERAIARGGDDNITAVLISLTRPSWRGDGD